MKSKPNPPSRGDWTSTSTKWKRAWFVQHLASGVTAVAEDSRSRERNRLLARERLLERLESADLERRHQRKAEQAKRRRQAVRRSPGNKANVLEQKRRRGTVKALRKRPASES